jgi:hypothetical protein
MVDLFVVVLGSQGHMSRGSTSQSPNGSLTERAPDVE